MRHARPSSEADEDVLCIVMVESVAAVEAIHEIVHTPGVDGALLGPADLSLSAYGALGGDLEAMKAKVADACRDAGVWAGIACGVPQDAAHAYSLGFQLILLGWDLALLEAAETDLLNQSREALGPRTNGG